MSAECGKVWKDTWAKLATEINHGLPLDGIQIATWNDYDEGTAIEPGVENCVGVGGNAQYDLNAGQGMLVWSASDWFSQTPETIDHFELFITDQIDETLHSNPSLRVLDSNIPVSTFQSGAFRRGLAQYDIPAGAWDLYIKAVGKPGYTNKISAAIEYCGNVGSYCLRRERTVRPSREIPEEQTAYRDAPLPPPPGEEPPPDDPPIDPPPDDPPCYEGMDCQIQTSSTITAAAQNLAPPPPPPDNPPPAV